MSAFSGPKPPPPRQGFTFTDNIGALVWVKPIKYNENEPSPWGVRPTVWFDIEAITDAPEITRGKRFTNIINSSKMLPGQLAQSIGEEIFGRIVSVPSSANPNNPSYKLDPPYAGDTPIITAWLERHTGVAQLGAASNIPAGTGLVPPTHAAQQQSALPDEPNF